MGRRVAERVDIFAGVPGIPHINKCSMSSALTDFAELCEADWSVEQFGIFVWDRLSRDVKFFIGEQGDSQELPAGVKPGRSGFHMSSEWMVEVLDTKCFMDREIEVRRYCLLGIGHSHPGGNTDPSAADIIVAEAVREWRKHFESPLSSGNWILAKDPVGFDQKWSRCLVQYTSEGKLSEFSY